MTHEQKQLLIKDLCGRLPYEVICKVVSNSNPFICGDHKLNTFWLDKVTNGSCDVKPYLRPISSLTPEECDKLFEILDIREDNGDWLKINDINVIRLFTEKGKDFYEIAEAIEYLYSIHVDFRDMIEKGLALEAKEKMYKTV